ncbi:MAG: folate-binding protein [Oceanicaulis sp.]
MTGYLTALPRRAVLHVTGADAKTFLQRVITRGPEGVAPGRAMFSALLTPQGKVLADLFLLDDGEGGLFIDLPASEADALTKRFTLYRLRAKAELTLREDLSMAAAKGEGEDELRTVALVVATDPRDAAIGLRAVVPAGGPADDAAYDIARIAARAPEFGADYGAAEVFSTDVNHDLLSGIDYKKGCFVGQEVASRMHRKGGVRKRTVRIETGAAPGAAVKAGETEVGSITSAGGGLALALVRADRLQSALDAGEALTAGEAPAVLKDDLTAL